MTIGEVMPLLPPFGKQPADPRYLTFAKRVDTAMDGKVAQARQWWSPVSASWFEFPLSEWDRLDVNLAGPPSPFEQEQEFGAPGPTFHIPAFTDGEELFYGIDSKYSTVKSHSAGAAWNAYTGQWRVMRPKNRLGVVNGNLVELDRKIAEVKDRYDRGLITDEIRDQLILELMREYI